MSVKKIQSALISVYYKDGLAPIIQELHKNGVTLYSTGGTQSFIEELGIPVIAVEDLTGYPSIFGGRVKTLHPKVFGGILHRRDLASDVEVAKQYDIPALDLVMVDLYPFEETVASGASDEDIIEKIDIGGISLIRGGAKNFNDVLIVSSRDQYAEVAAIFATHGSTSTSLEERRRFAGKAFQVSSHYDGAIQRYFAGQIADLANYTTLPAHGLRYGENPHQQGKFYGDLAALFDKLHGKELSYNNLVDVDACLSLLDEFKETGGKAISIETPDKANAFFLAYQPLKISDSDPNYAALELSNYMLGGGSGLSSRLMNRIRQKDGLSYGVGSQFVASPLDQSGAFIGYAIYAPENLAKLESAFKEEIEKVLKEGFTQKEIDEAKKSWLQSRQVTRSQDNALVGSLNSNLFLGRNMKWSEELENKVKSLTPAQIQEATQKSIDLLKMSFIKAGDYEGAAKKMAEKAKNSSSESGAMGGAPKQ